MSQHFNPSFYPLEEVNPRAPGPPIQMTFGPWRTLGKRTVLWTLTLRLTLTLNPK